MINRISGQLPPDEAPPGNWRFENGLFIPFCAFTFLCLIAGPLPRLNAAFSDRS